ncbi:hypothetical protein ABN028_19720 [Actinopolymorpha sp. B17G11]|uniref:hypothetical protein n=1 Tax=Actinopolymorpha sp. B17G11 TaxID=3160861 RepID=UPI0032E4D247
MRALTVRQPWAWAIIHGGKSIENRRTLWRYRGQLAIHAGVAKSAAGMRDEHVRAAWSGKHGPEVDPLSDLALGAIVGVVDLVDIHRDADCCRPWGMSAYDGAGGVTHLVLENPRPVEPILCTGSLGLWRPDDELLTRLEAAS